jgi:site-specific DNA-methyltransferase (adenine-specific)
VINLTIKNTSNLIKPYFETPNGKLYWGDCLDIMKELPDESVDLVVTDPPYGINFKSNHRKGMKSKEFEHLKNDNNLEWFIDFYKESLRLLKKDSYFYSFFRFDAYFDIAELFGKIVKPTSVLIWNKMDYGMGDLSDWSLSYEIVLVYKKGKPKLRNYRKRPNGMLNFHKVQSFACKENKPSGDKNQDFMIHPTQKPIHLIEELVRYSSNNNDIVLDCFAGGGNTLIACENLNRRWIGIELEQKYCDITVNRLKALEKYQPTQQITLDSLCKIS